MDAIRDEQDWIIETISLSLKLHFFKGNLLMVIAFGGPNNNK